MRTALHAGDMHASDTRSGLVTMASVEEVLAAIESVDLTAPWADVAGDLQLVLPRRRPMPPGTEDLPVRRYPLGIDASLGLDIGPAMLFVGRELLEKWAVGTDEAFDRAEANVRDAVRSGRRFDTVRDHIAGEPILAFQSGEGWASALLLMPSELSRVLGVDSGLILAPMRDLVVRMPLDTHVAL